MAPLRVAVLGAAGIAKKTCRALKNQCSDITVVAIASRSEEKANEFIKELDLEAAHPCTYQEALDNPDVEAVYIPLPTGLHVEWVSKAAAAGKHILLEKPIALTVADTEAIMEAVDTSGVTYMDGTMWMHNPRTAKMRKVLDDGDIGDVRMVLCTLTFDGMSDPDFVANDIRLKAGMDQLGALGDIGWYCTRAALWTYKYEPPECVQAHAGWVCTSEGVPIHGSASLIWSGGRRAIIDFSFERAMRQDLVIHGTDGSIRLEDLMIPYGEHVNSFWVSADHDLKDYATRVTTQIREVVTQMPKCQEALMWDTFAACVSGAGDAAHWRSISALTQTVVCKVMESHQQGGAVQKVG